MLEWSGEQLTVTGALTLRLNKAMLILAPSAAAQALVCKKVDADKYPEARLEVQQQGMA